MNSPFFRPMFSSISDVRSSFVNYTHPLLPRSIFPFLKCKLCSIFLKLYMCTNLEVSYFPSSYTFVVIVSSVFFFGSQVVLKCFSLRIQFIFYFILVSGETIEYSQNHFFLRASLHAICLL